jgi:hypothetical protein
MKLSFHKLAPQQPSPITAAVSLLKGCGFQAMKIDTTLEVNEVPRIIIELNWMPMPSSDLHPNDPKALLEMTKAWAGKGEL